MAFCTMKISVREWVVSRGVGFCSVPGLLQAGPTHGYAKDGPQRNHCQQDPAENHERDECAWIHIDILTPP